MKYVILKVIWKQSAICEKIRNYHVIKKNKKNKNKYMYWLEFFYLQQFSKISPVWMGVGMSFTYDTKDAEFASPIKSKYFEYLFFCTLFSRFMCKRLELLFKFLISIR